MKIADFPILLEVKNEYIRLRKEGMSRIEAVTQLKYSYHCEIEYGTEDDKLLFWIGLADAQYVMRELSAEEAKNGLDALAQIEQTDCHIAYGDIVRRRKWYANAPMPEKIKVVKPKKFRCSWQIGDTFAYMLHGNDAEKMGLAGRYVLFRKVGEAEESDSVNPIVTVSIWDSAPLPRTSKEFQRLPILKLDNGRAHTRKDQFIYRVEMLINNKTALKQLNLQYLGNFSDVAMPQNEAIIEYVGYMKKLALNRIDITCCNYWRNHHIYESIP